MKLEKARTTANYARRDVSGANKYEGFMYISKNIGSSSSGDKTSEYSNFWSDQGSWIGEIGNSILRFLEKDAQNFVVHL